MFKRALKFLEENSGKWIRLGTSIADPKPGTIEGAIWEKPYPHNYKTPYKTASHICDILVLASIAHYGYTTTPSGRKVQGVRL